MLTRKNSCSFIGKAKELVPYLTMLSKKYGTLQELIRQELQ